MHLLSISQLYGQAASSLRSPPAAGRTSTSCRWRAGLTWYSTTDAVSANAAARSHSGAARVARCGLRAPMATWPVFIVIPVTSMMRCVAFTRWKMTALKENGCAQSSLAGRQSLGSCRWVRGRGCAVGLDCNKKTKTKQKKTNKQEYSTKTDKTPKRSAPTHHALRRRDVEARRLAKAEPLESLRERLHVRVGRKHVGAAARLELVPDPKGEVAVGLPEHEPAAGRHNLPAVVVAVHGHALAVGERPAHQRREDRGAIDTHVSAAAGAHCVKNRLRRLVEDEFDGRGLQKKSVRGAAALGDDKVGLAVLDAVPFAYWVPEAHAQLGVWLGALEALAVVRGEKVHLATILFVKEQLRHVTGRGFDDKALPGGDGADRIHRSRANRDGARRPHAGDLLRRGEGGKEGEGKKNHFLDFFFFFLFLFLFFFSPQADF
jgi:hypothetical protein